GYSEEEPVNSMEIRPLVELVPLGWIESGIEVPTGLGVLSDACQSPVGNTISSGDDLHRRTAGAHVSAQILPAKNVEPCVERQAGQRRTYCIRHRYSPGMS